MFDAITATQLAMNTDQLKLQATSQNVSNINTPGFKKQLIESSGFVSYLQPNLDQVAEQLDYSEIPTQGAFTQTKNPTDLAISGNGYFQVQHNEGIFYTRRGDFHINNQGELTTATGEIVLGKSGAIKVDDHAFTIDTQGIVYIDHHKIDQINIVQFNQSKLLQYSGNGLYQSSEPPYPIDGETKILQGFVEQSNVKSMDEMMEMIKTSRHFEASQRIMRTADNLLASAISQLGEGNV